MEPVGEESPPAFLLNQSVGNLKEGIQYRMSLFDAFTSGDLHEIVYGCRLVNGFSTKIVNLPFKNCWILLFTVTVSAGTFSAKAPRCQLAINLSTNKIATAWYETSWSDWKYES